MQPNSEARWTRVLIIVISGVQRFFDHPVVARTVIKIIF
jgi:hypothetical protein